MAWERERDGDAQREMRLRIDGGLFRDLSKRVSAERLWRHLSPHLVCAINFVPVFTLNVTFAQIISILSVVIYFQREED